MGNAVQVLFSVNETEVDTYMVEKDLSSLDRSYLMHFIGFPVSSGSFSYKRLPFLYNG